MHAVRPAAVAGLFYPEDPERLHATVTALLDGAEKVEATGSAKALIAPHAGYRYSGPVAASAFAPLRRRAEAIRRVVLLGPAHHVAVDGLALPEAEALATPLGTVPVAGDLGSRLAGLAQVRGSARAHAPEHCLEVELPFLQVVLERFEVLPLLVGRAEPEEVAEVLDRLWGGDETLLVVSSDLSHYLPYDLAREVDRQTADDVVRLAGPLEPRRACGAGAINGLLVRARRRGLEAKLLDLRNSGDTAGDRTRVVGYGAFWFGEAA